MKSKVALIQCNSYEQNQVFSAINDGIKLLGGISAFVSPGETILIKPNLLAGDSPGKAVTTHPAVFGATAKVFGNHHATLWYGDSPGLGNPERVAEKTGLKGVAQEMGILFADFQKSQKVSFPKAKIAKYLALAKGCLAADGLISLCKMKTHALTRITGAVKNQFGCVPGLMKGEYHMKMPDIEHLSSVFVDITAFLKPRLYIMDGIVAMEGNGPRGGDPKRMKVLLFSTDPVALDAVFCQLINLLPEHVPFLKIGYHSGLGTLKIDEIELLGEDINSLIQPEFKVKRGPLREYTFLKYFPYFLKKPFLSRPVIDYNLCTNCGSCVLQCPVPEKAVNWPLGNKSKKPVHDYKNCIRCYCCQEICPEKAISVKVPSLGKILFR